MEVHGPRRTYYRGSRGSGQECGLGRSSAADLGHSLVRSPVCGIGGEIGLQFYVLCCGNVDLCKDTVGVIVSEIGTVGLSGTQSCDRKDLGVHLS